MCPQKAFNKLTSLVKPMPPQNCSKESVKTRARRPDFNLHIDANFVTSWPATRRSGNNKKMQEGKRSLMFVI